MLLPPALCYIPFGFVILFSGLIVNLIQLVVYIIVRPFSTRLYRKINKPVVELIWLQLIWLIDWWPCIKINLYADAETLEFLGKEHALVLCNHRSDIDWLVEGVIAQHVGCLGSLLAITKKDVKCYPIIGWAMWFTDCIFLEFNWAKDKNTLKAGFKRLKDCSTTFWLSLFVEGTRFTKDHLEAAQDYASIRGLPSPRHVLIPRTKGFVSAVSHLRSFVPAIYDFTIAVDKNQPTPTLLTMFSGQSSKVNLQIRRHKMNELPESDESLAQWCKDLFIAKDDQLEKYFAHGVFSDLEVHRVGRSVKPLAVVITWSCLLMYGSFKLVQSLSVMALWKIICLFMFCLSIATLTMQLLIQATESERSSPLNKKST